MTDAFVRRAEVVRVLDGDTFELRIDLGYRVYGRFMVRVKDLNTPELPTDEGYAAMKKATDILNAAKAITVRSYKDRMTFARWVADVYVDGQNFAELMR